MAASSAVKAGIKAVIYRNTGTYGSPTWTAITLARDTQTNAPWDLAEASVRATRVKLYHPTQIDFQCSATVRADDADTGYNALADAAVSGTALDLLILDGPISTEGTRGLRAHFHVSLNSSPEEIGGAIYKTFDLKPGFSTDGTPKAIVTGASSALTQTSPG